MASLQRWALFICYRRVDGAAAARRLYDILKGHRTRNSAGKRVELDPYLDVTAPGIADWKSMHQPYLKKARALIVVCTPGAWIREGAQDWVHREIDWWLKNRKKQAPILIDPLMEGSLYVPPQIAARWPEIQRITLVESEWTNVGDAKLREKTDAIRAQIVGALLPSAAAIYQEELDKERRRVAALKRTNRRLVISEKLRHAAQLDAEARTDFETVRQRVARRAILLERRLDLTADLEAVEAPAEGWSQPEKPYRAENLRSEIAQLDEQIELHSEQAAAARRRGSERLVEADQAWDEVARNRWSRVGRANRPDLPRVFSVEVLDAGEGECMIVHYGPLDRPHLVLVNAGPQSAYRRSIRARLRELGLRDYGGKPVPIELLAIGDQDEQKTGGLAMLLEEIAGADDKHPPPAVLDHLWMNIFRVPGRRETHLRNRIRALADELAIPLNQPFGPFLMRPEHGQLVHRLEGGLRIAILGPSWERLADLRKMTQLGGKVPESEMEPLPPPPGEAVDETPIRLRAARPIVPAGSRCVASLRAPGLAGGNYSDAQRANLASTILLFEYAGQTFLHTGDARGDLILEGLAAAGLLDPDGRAQVDLMNIPHSGSRQNVRPDFFDKVRADSYLITGSGQFNNPAVEVLAGLIAARPCEAYRMILTTRDYERPRGQRPPPAETMDEFFATEQRNHPNYRREFLSPRRGSIFVDLLEPLP